MIPMSTMCRLAASALVLVMLCPRISDAAPFGIQADKDIISNGDGDGDNDGHDAPLVDLADEDLLEAMEQFALMSDEEREMAFADVLSALGADDPDMVRAVEEIMEAVRSGNIRGNDPILEMVDGGGDEATEDARPGELSEAAGDALDALAGGSWADVRARKDQILDSIIAKGKISDGDAALCKRDDDAWERELRTIWDELQKQADERASRKVQDEL